MTEPQYTVKCDRTDCLRRDAMVWCYNFPKYQFRHCCFYESAVAIPELREPNKDGLDIIKEAEDRRKRLTGTNSLDYDLDEKKVEENRGLEE